MFYAGDDLELELRTRHRDERNELIRELQRVMDATCELVASSHRELCRRDGTISVAKVFNHLRAQDPLYPTWSNAKGLADKDPAGGKPLNLSMAVNLIRIGQDAGVPNLDRAHSQIDSCARAWHVLKAFVEGAGILERKFQALLSTTKAVEEIRREDFSDKAHVEELCRIVLRAPMIEGDRSAALDNLTVLTSYVWREHAKLDVTRKEYGRLLETVLTNGAFICYRVGDDQHGFFLRAMRRLNDKIGSVTLQQKIWSHEHYSCLSGASAIRALNHANENFGLVRPGGLRRRSEDFTRLFVFACEVGIHNGVALDEYLASSHDLRMADLLNEAYEYACEREEFDSALRFRTVPVRALLWKGSLNRAQTELDKIDIELRDREDAQRAPLWHVRHRISIDKALLAYLESDHDGDDERAMMWLADGRAIAKRLGIPFLTPAHEAEYSSKWDAFSE